MAKADLTAARLRELLNYDPLSGVFTRLVAVGRHGRYRVGDVAGHLNRTTGYRELRIDGTLYAEHRLAWLHTHGEWPASHVDHKDGIGSHNWIENLRDATVSQNLQNRHGAPSNSTSGEIGVSWNKRWGKWVAHLMVDGRQVHYSGHTTKADAVEAARDVRIKHHPYQTMFDGYAKMA